MTKRRSASVRRKSKRAPKRGRHLSLDQQLDILGYVLLALAGLTLLSFPSSSHGVIPRWWLRTLRLGFGWGAYLTPLLIGAVGLWLVLRRFGEHLPKVTPQQVVGVLLLYLALLTSLHFPAAWVGYRGDLTAAARAGDGGGLLGAGIARTLLSGLGGPGTAIAMVTWWLIALLLALQVTLEDIVRVLQPVATWIGRWPIFRKREQVAPLGARVVVPPPPDDFCPPVTEPPPSPPVAAPVIKKPPLVVGSGVVPPSANARSSAAGDAVWRLPAVAEILEPGNDTDFSAEILRQQARVIEETLASLGAPARVMEINRGPVITQFCVEPGVVIGPSGKEARVKVSRIAGAANDLALALEAKTIRVEAPIPGKGLVGIEVPNPEVSLVALRDVIESEAFLQLDAPLKLALGQDVSGRPVVADLTAMPHLLIAGTTGSGKSVCINAIIATLLLQHTPETLRLLLIDPKRVELVGYSGIPHLLSKVVIEMERVPSVLQWLLREMEGRYRLFSERGATNIADYNRRIALPQGEEPLPYIVVVIDELADMMMTAPQETERAVCRIAQMARATGIHLIVATQRPSVDVVTGLIKANFPARIAFNVASAVDSRVILDMPGAEQLLGQGDMLFLPPDSANPIRLQGAFVSDEELRRLVHHWREQAGSEAAAVPVEAPLQQRPLERAAVVQPEEPGPVFEDPLLPEVIEIVLTEGRASISLLQRKLRIGYTRAARIMDILEQHGVVGPQPPGGQAREVFPQAARALLHPQEQQR